MPKVVDAGEQRRQIRRAAQRAFATRGVRGTGLAHVAEAAGMGRSSLYHYYRDKDELLRDLVNDALDGERALFSACLAGDGPALARVQRLLSALLATFDEWSEVGRMLLDFRLHQTKRFRQFFREARAQLARVLSVGQERGEIAPEVDAERAAAALIGAVDGLLFQFFVDPEAFADREALHRELARMAERTLAP